MKEIGIQKYIWTFFLTYINVENQITFTEYDKILICMSLTLNKFGGDDA